MITDEYARIASDVLLKKNGLLVEILCRGDSRNPHYFFSTSCITIYPVFSIVNPITTYYIELSREYLY